MEGGYCMNLRNNHIVFITPGFPKDKNDINCIPPLQIYTEQLMETYPELKVSVVTLQYPHEKKMYTWKGVDVYPCFMGHNPWKSPLKWRKAVRTIERIRAKHRVDLTHCFWYTDTVLVGRKIKRRQKIPMLITLMGQDSKKKNKYLKLIKVKEPKVIALSERQAREFEGNSGYRVSETIPWGIRETELYAEEPERTIDILGVGSLNDIKDYDRFLETIALLKIKKPGISVKVLGGGRPLNAYREQTLSMGLDQQVEFVGEVSRTEVLEYMKKSKVLLHTSKTESLGYVFYEALANGMRIVSTPVGVAKEGEFWSLGSSSKELCAGLLNQLQFKVRSVSKIPMMSETVKEYIQLYGRISV